MLVIELGLLYKLHFILKDSFLQVEISQDEIA